MDLTTAFWFAAGVIILLVLLQVLAQPLEIFLRVLGNSMIGGMGLWAVNLVGGLIHVHLALNPVTAVMVGMLGVPGLVALGVMRAILG
jgi:inhibitor of the pro-sigma K processing machinery